MIFIWILSIFLALICLALAIIIINLVLVIIIRVPYVNTPQEYLKQILAAIELKPGSKIYDLGCGSADFLALADRFHPAKTIGWEISPWAYLIATLKHWSRSKIEIRLQSFFKADLREADLIYVYLLPRLVAKLSEKFTGELKPGTQVITVGSPLPDKKPQLTIMLDAKLNYKAYFYKF